MLHTTPRFMQRLRSFLALSIGVAFVWAGQAMVPGGTRPAFAETTLKAQFFLPKGHPISKRLEAIYRIIEKDTAGAVAIRSFYASELVPLQQALDGLSKGTLDLLVGPGNYYSGKVAIADFGIMPLNFKRYGDRSKAYYQEGLGAILQGVYGKLGITVVAPYNYFTGEEVLVAKGKTVSRFADFKGMKIRVAGGELIEMVKAMKAQPAFIAPPELYTAMQRHTVDGAIFPAHDLFPLKLNEVVSSVVGPDYLFSGPMMHLFKFNTQSWNALSQDVRRQIEATLRRVAIDDDVNSERELTALYLENAKKAGVKFVTLSVGEIAKAKAAVDTARAAYLKYNREQGHEQEAQQVLAILDRVAGK